MILFYFIMYKIINMSRILQILAQIKRTENDVKFLKYQPQQMYFWSTKDETLWVEILNTEYKAHKTQSMLYYKYNIIHLGRRIIILYILFINLEFVHLDTHIITISNTFYYYFST